LALNPEYIKQFYVQHLADGKVQGDELRAPCPAHDDNSPSFSVSLSTGAGKCFNPECVFGNGFNMYQFLAHVEQITLSEAEERINSEHNEKFPHVRADKKTKAKPKFPYTQADIEKNVAALLDSSSAVNYLVQECGWTHDTIKKFEVGYSLEEQAYWVPIKVNLQIVNIRKYKPNSKMKWFSVTDFGEARLFPVDNLKEETVYIMEGEKDCILACQLGLNAVAPTCGCGTFKTEWKKDFVDKHVVICYDVDPAGRDGAHKVYSVIGHVARSVKIIELPLKEPENGDFTDYILQGNRIQDFHALVQSTEVMAPENDAPVEIPDNVHTTELDLVDEQLLFYKRSKMNVRVIGADASPYIVPRTVEVSCNKNNGKACYDCRVGDKGGKDKVLVNETTPRMLDMIECKAQDKIGIIRDIFQIPACRKFKTKEKDHQAVHRVSIIPAIDEIQYDATSNQSYVERELYFIGERLISNTDYTIEALAIPSPKDQSLVHLGYKKQPADSSIEEFRMTVELKEKLGIFQCKSETN
jgi:hypothetical protein